MAKIYTREFSTIPELEKLHIYTQMKLALADQLRLIREALKLSGRMDREHECEELMVKLAEDRFTLVVLGQYNRGKSSLMNAIIGKEILPTGVLPLTSAITTLKYGPVERMVISRLNSNFSEELPVSSLTDFVTENKNPGNQKKVKTVYVELPVPFLRCGIEFVDTPGIGSSISANSLTTYSFLPECDAVVFTTSIDTPMTSLEVQFLNDIREYVNKIFLVVNKIDLLEDDERGKVLEYISEIIKREIGNDKLKIFPVSALLALSARKTGDSLLFEQSGIKVLEESLASFLSKEKTGTFLSAVTKKALRILEGEEVLGEIRSRLLIYYDRILAGQPIEMTETKFISSDEKGHGIVNTKLITEATKESFDIISDLKTRGCPVCKHMTENAADFFVHWQNRVAMDEKSQSWFAEEHGFCPLHTWQLMGVSSPQGASLGYAKLTEKIAREIIEKDVSLLAGDEIQQMVPDSGNCHVCENQRQAEKNYIHQLARFILKNIGLHHYLESQGVCLRHLGMLVKEVSSEEINKSLIKHSAQRLDEATEDMRNYSLKRDALRRSLLNRNEEDAYMRSVVHLVGDRMLCMPWLNKKS
jgi:GTPase SAR1 family protein